MEIKTGTKYQLIQHDMGTINEAVKRVRETPGGKVFAINADTRIKRTLMICGLHKIIEIME